MILKLLILLVIILVLYQIFKYRKSILKDCKDGHDWSEMVHSSSRGISKSQFCSKCGMISGSQMRIDKDTLDVYNKERAKEVEMNEFIIHKIRELAILHDINLQVAEIIYKEGMAYRLKFHLDRMNDNENK